jgi:peptide/nickel transport system substrate-binding protein
MTRITRRNFLKASAVTVLGAAVAACAQPAPTAAPTKPAAQPTAVPPTAKPVEPTKPFAVAPTNTPQAVPPTAIPKAAYKEAPMLAELVKAGKLPAVDQRLPSEPLVLDPVEKIGKYGGTMNMLTTGATDVGAGWNYAENFIKWNRDWSGHRPNLLTKWAWNANGTEITMYLRKGIKWSDGKPLTWDDWLFWFNDMIEDAKIALPRQTGTHIAGEAMKTKKVDDFTLTCTFAAPNPLFLEMLSRGGGARSSCWQIVPAHYMKQFHYKYNTAVKDTDTKAILDRYNSPSRYTFFDMPAINAWVVTELKQREYATLERNPYFWKTDKEGNQLPYIDKVQYKFMGDAQVLLLSATNGEADFGYVGGIKDIATAKANEAKGGYKVNLYNRGDNIEAGLMPLFCVADPGLNALIWNKKFRQALSLGIDRNKVNDIVFLGSAKPRQATQMPYGPEFQTERGKKVLADWTKHVADYKPEEAKKLLDEINVKDVNNDGWRERPDGSKLEIIVDVAVTSSNYVESFKLVKDDYQKIGLNLIMNVIDGTVINQRILNCECAFRARNGTAGGLYIAQSFWTPVENTEYCICGQPYGLYYQSGGKQGIAPPAGSPLEKLVKIYDDAIKVVDGKKRDDMVLDGYQIHIDEGPFNIGIVGDSVDCYVIKNYLKNVQTFGLTSSGVFSFPNTLDPEQWYLDK